VTEISSSNQNGAVMAYQYDKPGAPCLACIWPDVGVSEPPIREVFVLSWSLHLRPRGRVPTLVERLDSTRMSRILEWAT
jgi:hypothetical protein